MPDIPRNLVSLVQCSTDGQFAYTELLVSQPGRSTHFERFKAPTRGKCGAISWYITEDFICILYLIKEAASFLYFSENLISTGCWRLVCVCVGGGGTLLYSYFVQDINFQATEVE